MSYAIIESLNLKNAATQYAAENFKRIGNSVFFSPAKAIGDVLAPTDWAGLGHFEPDAQLSATANVERNDIKVQNPHGGPAVTLVTDVAEAELVYESIEVVTADEVIRALHTGAAPAAVAGHDGVTMAAYSVGTALEGRLMVLRLLEGKGAEQRFELFWHPRVELQNDGYGDYEGRATLQFRAPVKQWGGKLTGALADSDALKGPFGAIFTGTVDKLDELVAALKEEAKF